MGTPLLALSTFATLPLRTGTACVAALCTSRSHMPRHPYIIRRGGTLSYRVRVPAALVPVLGRRELKVALGTSCVDEARVVAAGIHAAVMRLWEGARVGSRIDGMSGDEIAAMTEAEFEAMAPGDQVRVVERLERINSDHAQDIIIHGLEISQLQDRAKKIREAMERVRKAKDRDNLYRLMNAQAKVANAQMESLRMASGQTRGAAPAPDPFEGLVPEARKPWHEHLPAFFVAAGLKPKTINNYNVTYRRLREQVGDKTAVEITAVDAVKFMESVVETGKARQGRTTVAANTQNKHASALKAFFGWAKGKLLCRENVASGLGAAKAAKKEAVKFERRPFTPDELKTLFTFRFSRGAKAKRGSMCQGRLRFAIIDFGFLLLHCTREAVSGNCPKFYCRISRFLVKSTTFLFALKLIQKRIQRRKLLRQEALRR